MASLSFSSSLFGPISYRTVEERPFTWQISNGYAVTNTRAAVEAEYSRFVAAPKYRAGRTKKDSLISEFLGFAADAVIRDRAGLQSRDRLPGPNMENNFGQWSCSTASEAAQRHRSDRRGEAQHSH